MVVSTLAITSARRFAGDTPSTSSTRPSSWCRFVAAMSGDKLVLSIHQQWIGETEADLLSRMGLRIPRTQRAPIMSGRLFLCRYFDCGYCRGHSAARSLAGIMPRWVRRPAGQSTISLLGNSGYRTASRYMLGWLRLRILYIVRTNNSIGGFNILQKKF